MASTKGGSEANFPLVCVCVCAKSLQSCLPLCDPMDCSHPCSSVHWILQARILEWVAMPSSRGSSQSRDLSWVSYISCTGRRLIYHQCHLGSPLLLLSLWKVIKKQKRFLFSKSTEIGEVSEVQSASLSLPPSYYEGSPLSKSEHPEQWRETRVGWLVEVGASLKTRSKSFQDGLEGHSPVRWHLLLWVRPARTPEPPPGTASAGRDLYLRSLSHQVREQTPSGCGQGTMERCVPL